jgi:hypothetical protein
VATVTTVTSSPNPSTFGEPVTVTHELVSLGNVEWGGEYVVVRVSQPGQRPIHVIYQYPNDPPLLLPTLPIRSYIIEAQYSSDGYTSGPPGTVVFSLNGEAVQTVELDSHGIASFSTSTLPAGEHLVSAAFSGALEFEASTSSTITQLVDRFNTQITFFADRNPSGIGGLVRFIATVTAPGGARIGDGLVSFFIDGVEQPPITITSLSRIAVFATSDLEVGEHEIVARFHSDEIYSSVVSDPIVHRVAGDGSVTIRVESDGAYTTFNFTSAAPELNLT